MATIDLAVKLGANIPPSVTANKFPLHYTDVTVDLAKALAAKGSALAAADVIEAIDIPAGSVIVAAGIEVITQAGGGGTVLTFDVGVTGGDVDAFVDGFDAYAATAGAFSAQPAAYQPVIVGGTADTLDILIATQTGVFNSGVFRVWAVYGDIRATRRPGLAQLKS